MFLRGRAFFFVIAGLDPAMSLRCIKGKRCRTFQVLRGGEGDATNSKSFRQLSLPG
jgi:hypothetical protein